MARDTLRRRSWSRHRCDLCTDQRRCLGRRNAERPTVLVATARTQGLSVFQSAYVASLATDPLDKAVTFGIVSVIVSLLPGHLHARFPGARGRELRRARLSAVAALDSCIPFRSWSRYSPRP